MLTDSCSLGAKHEGSLMHTLPHEYSRERAGSHLASDRRGWNEGGAGARLAARVGTLLFVKLALAGDLGLQHAHARAPWLPPAHAPTWN